MTECSSQTPQVKTAEQKSIMPLEQPIFPPFWQTVLPGHRLERKLDLLGERILTGVDRRIEAAEQRILASIDERLKASGERTGAPHGRLGAVADAQDGAAAAAAARVKEQRSADDRKRLKERLKDAIEHDQSAAAQGAGEAEREGWAEYLFGICRPDGRVGKFGSRWGHDAALRLLS